MKKQLLALSMSTVFSFGAWASMETAVKTNNQLGEKLATVIVETQKKPENFMVSGTSLQQAISIVANGSAGHTRAELENYLDASIEELNEANKVMRAALNFTQKQKEELEQSARYKNAAVLTTNNSIWRSNNIDGGVFAFSEDFKSIAEGFYGAEHSVLDFKSEKSVELVNKWAEEKTNGLVKEILDQDQLKDMFWVVMNATYMEAAWAQRFRLLTAGAPVFTRLNGEITVAEMMSSTQYVNTLELADGSEMISIKLKSDQAHTDLAFVAYLPKSNENFVAAQKNFFQKEIQKIAVPALVARNQSTFVSMTMPKFSFDYSVEMKKDEVLTRKMGLNNLFQNHVNFSRMSTLGSLRSKIGLIKQNTKIELDEKGIKAAAVTVIGGVRATSVGPRPERNIVLDRPFMFAIVDRHSQAVLFSGSLVNPKN